MSRTVEDRFWARVNKGDEHWEFTGCGRFNYLNSPGGQIKRFSYEFHIGPIPKGSFVVSKCGVDRCLRPDHLTIVESAHYIDESIRSRTEKICIRCNTLKPLSAYTPNKKMADGRFSVCKDCNNKRDREKRALLPKPELKPLIKRLMEKLDTSGGPDSCWPFHGTGNMKGYGMISVGQGMKVAHRISYELWTGPIKDGMTIDHLCRNKRCCNPLHLEQVTGIENSRRSPNIILNKNMVRQMRHDFEVVGLSRKEISEKFKIKLNIVQSVMRYQTWAKDMGD